MMPNMDPRALKRMMESMGIRQTEVDAQRVVIECVDRDIVIEPAQVTIIDAKGQKTYTINGEAVERPKEVQGAKIEINDDDVQTVQAQTGADADRARAALEETNGDIAEAIMRLKKEG